MHVSKCILYFHKNIFKPKKRSTFHQHSSFCCSVIQHDASWESREGKEIVPLLPPIVHLFLVDFFFSLLHLHFTLDLHCFRRPDQREALRLAWSGSTEEVWSHHTFWWQIRSQEQEAGLNPGGAALHGTMRTLGAPSIRQQCQIYILDSHLEQWLCAE